MSFQTNLPGSVTLDCTYPYSSLMDFNDDQIVSFKGKHY